MMQIQDDVYEFEYSKGTNQIFNFMTFFFTMLSLGPPWPIFLTAPTYFVYIDVNA